jgi:hypothetical protein
MKSVQRAERTVTTTKARTKREGLVLTDADREKKKKEKEGCREKEGGQEGSNCRCELDAAAVDGAEAETEEIHPSVKG